MAFIAAPGQPPISQITSSYAPTTQSGVSENAIAANFDWTHYPIVSTYGQTDAQGNYWQPDINVGVPNSEPITNLLPGTVTDVRRTTWGQNVVTVVLDQPINSLATHQYYEHLSSVNVSPGQHIASGALVGTWKAGRGIASIGYGFTPDDAYGTTGWNTLQQDLAPGGKGLLKADWLIKNFSQGKGPTGLPINQYSKSQSLAQNAPCQSNVPIIGGIWCAIQDFLEHILIIGFGIILFVLGLFLLGEQHAIQIVKKVAPV